MGQMVVNDLEKNRWEMIHVLGVSRWVAVLNREVKRGIVAVTIEQRP